MEIKPKNRNDLISFFREKRDFVIVRKSGNQKVREAIFSGHKEIIRILSNVEDHRFGKDNSKLGSEISYLCQALNGSRVNSERSFSLLKKDLETALEQRLKKELNVDDARFHWFMASFELIFSRIYRKHLEDHLISKGKKLPTEKPLTV